MARNNLLRLSQELNQYSSPTDVDKAKEYWIPKLYVPVITKEFPDELIGQKYPERFSGYGWYTGTVLNVERATKEGSTDEVRFRVRYCDGNELMRTSKSLNGPLISWLNKEGEKKKLSISKETKELVLKLIESQVPLQTRSEAAAQEKPKASNKKSGKKRPLKAVGPKKPSQKAVQFKINEAPGRASKRLQRTTTIVEKKETKSSTLKDAPKQTKEKQKQKIFQSVTPEDAETKLFQSPVPLGEVTLEFLEGSPRKFIGTRFYEYFVGFGEYFGKIKGVDEEDNFIVEYNDGTVYVKQARQLFSAISIIQRKVDQVKKESEAASMHHKMLAKKIKIAEEVAQSYAQLAKETSKKRSYQQMAAGSQKGDTIIKNPPEKFSIQDISENPEDMVGEEFFECFEDAVYCKAKVASVRLPTLQGQQPIFNIEYEDGHSNIKTVKRLYEALRDGKSKKGPKRQRKQGLNHQKPPQEHVTSPGNIAQENDEKVLRWKHGLEVNYEFPLFCGKRLNPYQKFCNAFARSQQFITRTKRDCLDDANEAWSQWRDDPGINMFLDRYSPENAKSIHNLTKT